MRVIIAPLFLREHSLEPLKRVIAAQEGIKEVLVAPDDLIANQLLQGDVDAVFACVGNVTFDQELERLQRLRGMTRAPILAIGPATEAKVILRTVQIGADVFLDQADLEVELNTAMARLQLRPEAKRKGQLMAVLSAAGGCGASTLAANIAAALAKNHGLCALIDLNPGRGDLTALLDLKPQYTLADACRNETRLDRPMFEKLLERHESGIRLLAASPSFDDARGLTSRGISQAIALAREVFTHAVVDMEDCFHDEQVAVLEQADIILVIARLDFTTLRCTRRVTDHLTKLGIDRSRRKVIINFHGQAGELETDEAEAALGEAINYFVPYDPKTINAANNLGSPAFLRSPNAKVCLTMAELSKISSSAPQGSSGLLPKLRNLWKAIG